MQSQKLARDYAKMTASAGCSCVPILWLISALAASNASQVSPRNKDNLMALIAIHAP